MNVLVAGWFSFEQMGATAGDLIARDILCEWLQNACIPFQVATAPPFEGGINWKLANPQAFTDIIFVCGPFGNGWPITEFLAHFSSARHLGLNLSMLQSLDEWNPFDILFERDSSATSRPDITLAAPPSKVPVVGVILAHKQKEYGAKALHEIANAAIQRLVNAREMSVVPIDTRLDENAGNLRTPGEVEALIARMDVVLTTRLHGTVLSLKNGIPVIPIDPIEGGAKITKQVNTLEWPVLFQAAHLNDGLMNEAFDYCLTHVAREKAKSCTTAARARIDRSREQFMNQLMTLV